MNSQPALAPENNTGFLKECAQRIPVINFADRDNGAVFARIERGTLVWTDPPLLEKARADHEMWAALDAMDVRGSEDPALTADGKERPAGPDFTATIGYHGRAS